MGELEDRLNSILSDPEQMARINRLAQSLMGGGEGGDASPPPDAGEPDSALLGKLGALLGQQGSDHDKQALLEAMKPWLSEKRRSKLDRALRLTRMAHLAGLAMGELGNGKTL